MEDFQRRQVTSTRESSRITKFTPVIVLLCLTGPDHDKLFVVGIYFGNVVADGSGKE